MRVARLCALALLVLAAAAPPAGGEGESLGGQVPPELTLRGGVNGASARTTIASLKGKVVLLKFWLTTCPRCLSTLARFQALHERFGRSGLVCLSVMIDSPEGATAFLRARRYTFPAGFDPDGRNATRWGVRVFPADFLIGADGLARPARDFPQALVDAALREQRLAEVGTLPPAMAAVRDAVARGDYGSALRAAEASAGVAGASEEVCAAARKVFGIAQARLQARLERAAAAAAAGRAEEAKAEYERAAADFAGTALEGKAKERPAAQGSPASGGLPPAPPGAILPPAPSRRRAVGRLA